MQWLAVLIGVSRVYRPAVYPRNMKLDSKTASFYHSRPSKWLDGRSAIVPCAHVLGGGSSINFMVILRSWNHLASVTWLTPVRCIHGHLPRTTMISKRKGGKQRTLFL